VVKYFEFKENAIWNKSSGQVQVAYIVQELIEGGELFDYVANSGPFSE
jgi:serine/threonine protein kinase